MFHVKHEAWGRWGDLLGLDIDAATAERLDAYERLLLEKALPLGMIGRADREHLHDRHVVDSLRAIPLLGPAPMQVVDVGSGAGLPGIPLALARPDLSFCLAELRRRRVAFLELAIDSLAFAEPARAWAVAESLLSQTGKLLFWAGRSFDVTSGTPGGARISVSTAPELAEGGPVVIMTRQ